MDLETFFSRFLSPSLVGRKVSAKTLIHQSPCSGDPDVPRGRAGEVVDVEDDDEDDVRVWVDFDGPYGVVLCDPSELKESDP